MNSELVKSINDSVKDIKFISNLLGKQVTIEFSNGYGASIIGGMHGQYGDGITTFELAVLHNNSICFGSPLTDDVLGWRTKEEVVMALHLIQALPPNPNCKHCTIDRLE